MNNSEIIKMEAYPIEKAIETSGKFYIHTVLFEIFDALNKGIKSASENGYYSATVNYEYPSFYSDFKVEQVKDIVKKIYEKEGYIVKCGENSYKKNNLLFTVTWVDKELMGE